MITYDEFEQMVKEELSLLPDYVREDLSGGVLIDPTAYLHPARAADDLYILGTYSRGGYMGKQIILYYGSFMAAMGYATRAAIQNQVRETLRHEFLHHMETKHPALKDKPLEFFKRKKNHEHKEEKQLLKATISSNVSAWRVSFLVANYIAKARKPFTIGEELIWTAVRTFVVNF